MERQEFARGWLLTARSCSGSGLGKPSTALHCEELCESHSEPQPRAASRELRAADHPEHPFDILERRDGVHRAAARAAHGGGSVRESEQRRGRIARAGAVDERAAKDVARPCRVDGVHRERGGVVHAPAIHNHRAAATQGDAHQRAVSFVQYPERAADLGLTGQCRRHVLGQNRNADRRDELLGPIGDAIDIARDDGAGGARQRRHLNRGLLVDIVDVHDSGGGRRSGGNSSAPSAMLSSRLQSTMRSPVRSSTRITANWFGP